MYCGGNNKGCGRGGKRFSWRGYADELRFFIHTRAGKECGEFVGNSAGFRWRLFLSPHPTTFSPAADGTYPPVVRTL